MTSPLQRSADIITRAAGWKEALPDDDGVFHFSLEGGLDFELFSPENRTGILFAVLGSAPEQDARADDTLLRLASLSAGSLKKTSFYVQPRRERSRTVPHLHACRSIRAVPASNGS